ncbi:DUF1540 domain-containing protein [Paenibacillus sp. JX-17]|uniref:DUF1540 domain-containing protein n=1 Tax=Paenibacillus lacisoli TaxID=3064525 RepID=A0ABT9C868_9BACL|nr:DUF1540 domain-containing protein [Paenibacillus sp. JX-17]MDO7905437.1 DUF1540 domain-containing protein [Paenibacillus sp. JX-17]
MSSEAKPFVKCSVSNCHYWGEHNVCKADLIMIDIDSHADRRLNEEFAGEYFDSHEKDTAPASAATCCHTFKQKHKS